MRLWATLMSFMVSRAVNVYIETKNLGNDVSVGNVIHYAGNMVLLLVVDAYLVSLLYGKFDEDDELDDKALQVAKETGLGLLAGIPGVRDIEAARYGSGNTPIGTATNDIFHVAAKASEGDFDRKFWRHSTNLLGILTGAPSSAINRTVDVAMSDDPEAIEYILGEKRDK